MTPSHSDTHPTHPVTTLYADDVARLHRAGHLNGPHVHRHGPILTLARHGALLTLLITDAGYLPLQHLNPRGWLIAPGHGATPDDVREIQVMLCLIANTWAYHLAKGEQP